MTKNLSVRFRIAWWLPLYFGLLIFFCHLMGTYPNEEKLQRVVLRALKLDIT